MEKTNKIQAKDIKKAIQKQALERFEQGLNLLFCSKLTPIEKEHYNILFKEYRKLKVLLEL